MTINAVITPVGDNRALTKKNIKAETVSEIYYVHTNDIIIRTH